MSGSQPSKRRRIAGEAKPEVAANPEVTAPNPPRLPKLRRPTGNVTEDSAAPYEQPSAAPVSTSGFEFPAMPVKPPRAKFAPAGLALIAVAVLAVVFGVVGAVVGYNQWHGQNIADSRTAASDVAGSAAAKIFSYQYNQLPQHLAEAQATMTPSFAKKFKEISPALNALAPQRKIQVKAVVRDAATVECGDACSTTKANVLIFIDQARVADGAKTPTVFGNRILVSMVKTHGRWLVNDIKAL